jgi:glycosyltransferase involved in cell wall biosynthesis
VLEVVGSLAIGGAERVAIEVAAGLRERGWDTELLCVAPGSAAGGEFHRSVEAEARRSGVAVSHVPFTGVLDRGSRRRVAAFLRERGVGVVHVHNRPEDWQLVSLCTVLRIPVIYTVHLTYAYPRLRHRLLFGATGLLVPRVVCVSRAVAESAIRNELLARGKERVVYNGIRMELFRPPSPDERAAARRALGWSDAEFVWICAARLAEQKGHRFLLDGMARLPGSSRARLALAGDGALEGELRALASRLGIADRVQFLGARRDVPTLLGAADGFATATLQEGHPLALLEAVAMELPVVAPRLPSITEIAFDGSPVLYGPPRSEDVEGHDPDTIAAALSSVEADPRRHREVARAGRHHVASRYSRDAMIDAHAELYEEALALASEPVWTQVARRVFPARGGA